MSSNNQQQLGQKTPRISTYNATFAQIIVGPHKRCFTVHLDLLVYHSRFFRAALTGSFKEASEKVVTLPHATTGIFELFVHWLYYQRLPMETDSSELFASYRKADNPFVVQESLVLLYAFCDQYAVPGLKRLCLDTLFYEVTEEPSLPHFDIVRTTFVNLETEQDPLCRFWVDHYCYWGGENCWTVESIQDLPLTFVTKVLNQYTNLSHGGRDDWLPELCNYHDHATSKERNECEENRER
ncbi:hypothetical protein ACET3X_003841 [Alternaria dauci]|uniref:BTB domain-containing protein n=1 Tax=Alternaria dauci TaxID=48095 RepID=A0ABR3UL45_9PLEO